MDSELNFARVHGLGSALYRPEQAPDQTSQLQYYSPVIFQDPFTYQHQQQPTPTHMTARSQVSIHSPAPTYVPEYNHSSVSSSGPLSGLGTWVQDQVPAHLRVTAQYPPRPSTAPSIRPSHATIMPTTRSAASSHDSAAPGLQQSMQQPSSVQSSTVSSRKPLSLLMQDGNESLPPGASQNPRSLSVPNVMDWTSEIVVAPPQAVHGLSVSRIAENVKGRRRSSTKHCSAQDAAAITKSAVRDAQPDFITQSLATNQQPENIDHEPGASRKRKRQEHGNEVEEDLPDSELARLSTNDGDEVISAETARKRLNCVDPKIKDQTLVDILRYSEPGEDLNWTAVKDKAKRKQLQTTLKKRKDRANRAQKPAKKLVEVTTEGLSGEKAEGSTEGLTRERKIQGTAQNTAPGSIQGADQGAPRDFAHGGPGENPQDAARGTAQGIARDIATDSARNATQCTAPSTVQSTAGSAIHFSAPRTAGFAANPDALQPDVLVGTVQGKTHRALPDALQTLTDAAAQHPFVIHSEACQEDHALSGPSASAQQTMGSDGSQTLPIQMPHVQQVTQAGNMTDNSNGAGAQQLKSGNGLSKQGPPRVADREATRAEIRNWLQAGESLEDMDWTVVEDRTKRQKLQSVLSNRKRRAERARKKKVESSWTEHHEQSGPTDETVDEEDVQSQIVDASQRPILPLATSPKPNHSLTRPRHGSDEEHEAYQVRALNGQAVHNGGLAKKFSTRVQNSAYTQPKAQTFGLGHGFDGDSVEFQKTIELQMHHVELQMRRTEMILDLRGVKYGPVEPRHIITPPASLLPKTDGRPAYDFKFGQNFVQQLMPVLAEKERSPDVDHGRSSAYRVRILLSVAEPPNEGEMQFLTGQEAEQQLQSGVFFDGPIITEGQQALPLHTLDQFLDEYYDDSYSVFVQDPAVKIASKKPSVREVTVKDVKQRLRQPLVHEKPWNCLELATHAEDGLRPAFLNTEDCRLLTKLKFPNKHSSASRHGYTEGWKEVEKWALVAQAGALTEPHQDSHGYSTYITVNHGYFGYGWLSNPTVQERTEWRKSPQTYIGGRWRYVVLKPGQTVYFPAGTVHFVFRHPAAGNTLAFGGHVLRCSQIVHWITRLLEEQTNKNVRKVTNEDLSASAPGYLDRVERFVKQAQETGQQAKWGGADAVKEFLKLKQKSDRSSSAR